MLTFRDLLTALQELGITRYKGAIATGFGEGDEALERYVELNKDFEPKEAARQLAQCLGETGQPLYGLGA